MTPEEQKAHQQRIRAEAQRDLSDIAALEKSEPFNRYFVGQINRLYHDNVELSLTASTRKERTKARHRAVLLRELTQMPAKHRESAEKLLRTPMQEGPTRPTQVG